MGWSVTLYDLKPAFQGLLRPLVGRLARAGVSANLVTCSAAFGSLALGVALCLLPSPLLWLALAPWMLVRMALNAIDGMLAREFSQASALGAYLNELGDVVSDASLILPFAFPDALAPALALVFAATVSELAGALGVGLGAGRRNDGPMGKSDRALLLALLALWHGFSSAPFPWLGPVLWTASALVVVNTVRRVASGARLATSRP